MRIVLAILFIVHGIAHLPGFVVPWRLATLSEMPYKTTMLGGTVDVGSFWIRLIGILWLLAGLGFGITGVAAFRNSPVWPTIALVVTLSSLALTVLGWPEARIGLALNVIILAYLLLGARAGWLPGGTGG
jgi:hypothetical protein